MDLCFLYKENINPFFISSCITNIRAIALAYTLTDYCYLAAAKRWFTSAQFITLKKAAI